eukprot:TRINITY_DN3984_c0_g1_i1.p1 TRINITY_DN3984_c0_g1~~TRINITY_DN3984_c0_g1_i1.p1  ORF type:complete len:919 (+),score=265.76 TRINITY_DN3984_c0_g1_i1:39-2795(+)
MSKKVDYDFIVEYAKSGRSKCSTTKDLIPQGEMRIGQMVQSPKFDGKYPVWHHYQHFFDKPKGLTQFEMLHGREKLRLEDQEELKKLIKKHSGGGTKRKADSDTGDEPPKKKKKKNESESEEEEEKKEETAEEKAVREENELIWKIKDNLGDLKPKELKEILEKNGQSTKGGKDALLDRIVVGMLFGALPTKCGNEECEEGHLYYDKTSATYKCSGHSSAWARCQWESATVEVSPWKLPKWVKEDIDYFSNWKFEKRERAIVKSTTVRAEVTDESSMAGKNVSEEQIRQARMKRKFFNIGKKSETPFENLIFSFAGKLSKTQKALTTVVEALGGTVSSKVTPKVTHLIATQRAVDDEIAKVEEAVKFDIPIMSESFIDDSEEKKEFLDQKKYLIGGSDHAKKNLTRDFTDPKEDEAKELEASTKEKKVKLVMKGRAAVDPMCGQTLVDNYHVLDRGGTEIYDVVLNVTDVTTNTNSYYGLQILEHDKRKDDYQVFRKWGRVGTKIGSHKLEKFEDVEDAIDNFMDVYFEKTGNEWEDRDKFEKKPGKFFPIEIDYSNQGDDDEDDALKKAAKFQTDDKSKLDKRVQSLVSLIFDLKVMEESLKEMEIDLKKMPLGKLSKRHIQKGYEVLTEIDDALKITDETTKKAKILELTNKFYTLIPHDFGTKEITLINTDEELKNKMRLMEALQNIEIAADLLKQSGEGDSVIDTNYKKLKTDLSPIERDTEEFKMCNTYLENQKGEFTSLQLIDAFKVNREGEDERFQKAIPLGNRQMLWHGSRVTNYVGILSTGLRIAPPEAPKSGYRFGKGIYFADVCEKSAFYCRGNGDYILMMLVDVALGKQKELLHDQYMEQALPGFDSTKAMGGIAPKGEITLENGVKVPYGKPGNTGIRSSCTHNEYIIYKVEQACIRYLLKIRMT